MSITIDYAAYLPWTWKDWTLEVELPIGANLEETLSAILAVFDERASGDAGYDDLRVFPFLRIADEAIRAFARPRGDFIYMAQDFRRIVALSQLMPEAAFHIERMGQSAFTLKKGAATPEARAPHAFLARARADLTSIIRARTAHREVVVELVAERPFSPAFGEQVESIANSDTQVTWDDRTLRVVGKLPKTEASEAASCVVQHLANAWCVAAGDERITGHVEFEDSAAPQRFAVTSWSELGTLAPFVLQLVDDP